MRRVHKNDEVVLFGTNKESERWTIELLAEDYRGKFPPEVDTITPGYHRRSRKDWQIICNNLASIQDEYNEIEDVYPRYLKMRVLMLIWPKMMKTKPRYSKLKSRKAVMRARDEMRGSLYYLWAMAAKQFPSSPGLFDMPRIEIRTRRPSERYSSDVDRSIRWNNETANEIIGRAVLLDYREHRDLDSALRSIADREIIDDIKTGKHQNVRRRYHEYRRLAFQRGYADSRAFWCEYESAPWPQDQVWLIDFPDLTAN